MFSESLSNLDEEIKKRFNYQIGPNDDMKKELGQIVANHALCDSAIYKLFVLLLGAPALNGRVLVKSQSLKAFAMTKTIKALIEENCIELDAEFKNRILSALEMFRVFTRERNKLVHWQWSATDAPIAELTNEIGAINPKFPPSESISMQKLRETALALAGIAVELLLIISLLDSGAPIELSKASLAHLDEILKLVKKALLVLPPVSDEDLS